MPKRAKGALLVPERRSEILRRIERYGSVRVSALSDEFGVTEETIRRDLEELEQEGLLKRTYGGAVVEDHGIRYEPPFSRRSAANREAKTRIAAAAAALVIDGETIAVDASTTALELVRHLPRVQGLTVLTNSVHVVFELAQRPGVRVMCTGGMLRESSLSLVGPMADRTLSSHHVDKAFLSGKGFTFEHGLTDSNELEVEVKKRMAESAAQVIALVDQTKLGYVGFCQIVPSRTIDALVCDAPPPAADDPALVDDAGIHWIRAADGPLDRTDKSEPKREG